MMRGVLASLAGSAAIFMTYALLALVRAIAPCSNTCCHDALRSFLHGCNVVLRAYHILSVRECAINHTLRACTRLT